MLVDKDTKQNGLFFFAQHGGFFARCGKPVRQTGLTRRFLLSGFSDQDKEAVARTAGAGSSER